jgi:hypothetical protein
MVRLRNYAVANLPRRAQRTNSSPRKTLLRAIRGERSWAIFGVRHNLVDIRGIISETLLCRAIGGTHCLFCDLVGQRQQFNQVNEPQQASLCGNFAKRVSRRKTRPARG